MPTIALTVAPGGTTGWEVCAAALALQLDRLGWTVRLEAGVQGTGLDPLDAVRLRQMLRHTAVKDRTQLGDPDLVFVALGNDLQTSAVDPYGPDVPRIGYVFAEQPITEIGRQNAEKYTLILAGSTWLARQLHAAGIPAEVLLQGVDPILFSPRTRRPGPLTLFSGGKLEHRKAQDLVVKVHQALLGEFPDLRLLTAWHNPWPKTMAGMEATAAYKTNRVEIGPVPHYALPAVYAAADVALFPNRCEGGTNLVAMECLAMGIPCVISAGHGHDDLPGIKSDTLDWMTHKCVQHLRAALMQLTPITPHHFAATTNRGVSRVGPRTTALDPSWHWEAVGEQLHAHLTGVLDGATQHV